MNGTDRRSLQTRFMGLFLKESALVPAVSVVLGLAVGALLMLAGGYDPVAAYGALYEGVFGNLYNFGETIRQVTPSSSPGCRWPLPFARACSTSGPKGSFWSARWPRCGSSWPSTRRRGCTRSWLCWPGDWPARCGGSCPAT